MHYCECDIQIQSVVAVSDDGEVPVISDSSEWASLYRPLLPSVADPNEAPTEMAPSTPLAEEGRHLQFLKLHIWNLIKELLLLWMMLLVQPRALRERKL